MGKSKALAGHSAELELGKAAEHLVVADLILAGYRAYLTDQGLPYDVVVDLGGNLLRVQVKATSGLRSVPQRASYTPGYLFFVKRAGRKGRRAYSHREFDIIAFVALDIRVIAYMPMSDGLKQTINLRPPKTIPALHATRKQNIDEFTFDQCLADLRMPTALTVISDEIPAIEAKAACAAR